MLAFTLLLACASFQTAPQADYTPGFLKGVKPFAVNVIPDTLPVASRTRIRRYTMHVPFDNAVISAETEPGKTLWSKRAGYDSAEIRYAEEKKPSGLYINRTITVQRGRAVFGIKRPEGISGIGGTDRSLARFHLPKVDPTGWVTVAIKETYRVNDDRLGKLLPALTHNKAVSYCVVSWEPFGVMPIQTVDVHSGTAKLENHRSREYDFYRAGGED